MSKLCLTLAFLALLAPPLRADSAAPVAVENAWIRATPKGAAVAGGYATIVNHGANPDRLVGASLATAPNGEIHSMSMENGVMHMERLKDGATLAPGATLVLQPGGLHVMFMNPTAPLLEHQTVTGTLVFEKAGAIPVTFAVAGMAAKGAPDTLGQNAKPGMPMEGPGAQPR